MRRGFYRCRLGTGQLDPGSILGRRLRRQGHRIALVVIGDPILDRPVINNITLLVNHPIANDPVAIGLGLGLGLERLGRWSGWLRYWRLGRRTR